MMDKVTYKGKEEKRKKGYKVEVVRARHKPHRLGYKCIALHILDRQIL